MKHTENGWKKFIHRQKEKKKTNKLRQKIGRKNEL